MRLGEENALEQVYVQPTASLLARFWLDMIASREKWQCTCCTAFQRTAGEELCIIPAYFMTVIRWI